ncbi:MAG: hypothetical protein LBD41_06155 [Clostridiales Family XIII bacterium]|jgi:hypothetical protein|nr:hypothetical protein [Clostridiales Family XIII bacterium]
MIKLLYEKRFTERINTDKTRYWKSLLKKLDVKRLGRYISSMKLAKKDFKEDEQIEI